MKTSVVTQLPLLTCTLTHTNCTQSQVDTCSIVQFYGKLKCAKENEGIGNDFTFNCFKVTVLATSFSNNLLIFSVLNDKINVGEEKNDKKTFKTR